MQCMLHRQQWTPCAAAAATVTALLFTWITFQLWNEDEFILVNLIVCLRVLKNPRLPLSVYHLWFFFIWQQNCLLLPRHSFTRIYHRYFRHVLFKLCDLLSWLALSVYISPCGYVSSTQQSSADKAEKLLYRCKFWAGSYKNVIFYSR